MIIKFIAEDFEKYLCKASVIGSQYLKYSYKSMYDQLSKKDIDMILVAYLLTLGNKIFY